FAKKARNFAELVRAPLAIVEKRRHGNDSQAEALHLIGDVKGKSAIIVDDEIDTASSIDGAVKLLERQGAKRIFASCVHPILSGPAVERLRKSSIVELVATDTVKLDESKSALR